MCDPSLPFEKSDHMILNVDRQPAVCLKLVAAAINDLKETSAPGLDKISPKLLKISCDHFAPCLSNIIQQSLDCCRVPPAWLLSVVIPVYKKGDSESLCGNVKILGGVPQGSVLGPLLFLLYIADLPTHFSSTISMFANDTKLYVNPPTNYAQLTKDLEALKAWCSDWLLLLNSDKCTVLHLSKNNPMLSYNIAGGPLTVVDYQNDLGIIIFSDLKWKLSRRSFRNSTPSTGAKLFRMYFRPKLEFAAPAWSPYFAKDISTLERVQRWALSWLLFFRHRPYEEQLSIMKFL
ncbi:uncharacterized protein LOC135138642 [Zophobas morio]|uniref:uncharacterized protein LOC135138642 n=1 Tax=Zophobas morio TaxID=2755281 RepID=UPI003082B7A7